MARHPERAGVDARLGAAGAEARHPEVVISTFTSAQERAVLGKLLMRGRRFVRIHPGGIPPREALEPAVVRACELGSGLLISPVPFGTGLNKQRAMRCNEYVLKQASEVWAGTITPGGTIASLVKALGTWGTGGEARHPDVGGEVRRPAPSHLDAGCALTKNRQPADGWLTPPTIQM